METRQGKIEEKHLKFAKNKASYATFVIDGKSYNVWEAEIIDAHNPDDFVEFTGEKNAKGFWELKTMKKIDKIVTDEAVKTMKLYNQSLNGAKEYHLSPEEVKCRALECAIEYVNVANLDTGTFEDILIRADKFVEWIYGN